MKLILAIVPERRAADILSGLTADGYRATRVSTTGGFMRQGNATLLIGVEAQWITAALDKIRASGPSETERARAPEGATVFVLEVERFEQY